MFINDAILKSEVGERVFISCCYWVSVLPGFVPTQTLYSDFVLSPISRSFLEFHLCLFKEICFKYPHVLNSFNPN